MANNSYIENGVYVIVPETEYDVAILIGGETLDPINDNVDVEVRFKDGRMYTGSFFTIENIKSLLEKNKQSGECLSGLYFYCTDMIVVETLTVETIVATVRSLYEENLLEYIFDLHNLSES